MCNLSYLLWHLLALLYTIRAVDRYVQQPQGQKGVISQKLKVWITLPDKPPKSAKVIAGGEGISNGSYENQ